MRCMGQTYLEEAKFVGSTVGADDQSPDIPNVDITEGNGEC